MDVERSSLCNCVVNFLLEENYLLTAFELLHELLDDGRDNQAIRLKEFFSDPDKFPPDQISRFNSLRVADPQSLLEEKEAAQEKLAISEYELRLAHEDILKLKSELQKKSETCPSEATESNTDIDLDGGLEIGRQKRIGPFSDLGPLKNKERHDLNCAVKEYLLIAGYRLTAMTFYEEVTDQNLDEWQNTSACVPDALRHYYYQYLSSTTEAAEEKMAMLQENESLKTENKRLNSEMETLQKNRETADGQIASLTKSLEALQRDLKDKENLVQELKQLLENQRKELNDCRAEITSLKMHIADSHSRKNLVVNNVDESLERYKEEIESLQLEIEKLKAKDGNSAAKSIDSDKVCRQSEENVVEIHEDKAVVSQHVDKALEVLDNIIGQSLDSQNCNTADEHQELLQEPLMGPSGGKDSSIIQENVAKENGEIASGDRELPVSDNDSGKASDEQIGLETIQILADALPKIVPYVLINHREELLPLIMCAIERHPDSSTRDSLTHTLFNLIKRPDEQQRQIIMDACVTLAKNVGEMRTEIELLPQCWEQINHMYEERRLLVAQSCGQLAGFVRPEIRDSLILSIVQQLLEDPASVVRESAARNLAMLLPLFPNTDKYFKVEELMFQLVCDPSGVVVDSALKELVPSVIKWGNNLDHVLKVLLSHVLSSAEHCPPLSGVEGSVESYLHVLGERERWNIDVLLRMLVELLPLLHQRAVESCPYVLDSSEKIFSSSLLDSYARGNVEWHLFEWMHVNCFPDLINLACLLPQKEDNLRNRITKYLLAVSEHFGDSYLRHIMLPVFLVAVGDSAELTFFPSTIHSRIQGLRPRSAVAHKLVTMCVLPLLLAGVLGAKSMHDQLVEYLRKILVQGTAETQGAKNNTEAVDAVRFLCTFENHHSMIFEILWEMVVSSETNMKINAAKLLRVIVMVPYIDAKGASTHVLPALVTLGSDQNLNVKYASIDAFGAVAQHFKNDMIVEKIRVQMDAFLEDGSHEATIAVMRALVIAVPHTTERLRDYLLSKIFQFSAVTAPGSDLIRRRERANVFCEAIRALDATDIPAASIRDYFLPAIHNLIKDQDALDPAHKEALEIILKERSGGTFEAFSKVMGAHLGLASSVTSFFGESGLLGKRENIESPIVPPADSPKTEPPIPAPEEDTRFRRIMRGGFTDMLRSRTKGQDETQQSN